MVSLRPPIWFGREGEGKEGGREERREGESREGGREQGGREKGRECVYIHVRKQSNTPCDF